MKNIKTIVTKYAISILFLACIVVLGMGSLCIQDQELSAQENRPLQQIPKLSSTSIISGRYQEEMESYVSDQFPARSFFVKFRTNLEYILGRREFHDIYIGKENTLFQKSVIPSKKEMKSKIQAMNTFAQQHHDIPISMLLIPNKATILSELLPSNIKSQDQTKTMEIFQKGMDSRIRYVNPKDALSKNKQKYIYYRSDHHWTNQGAYIAFEAWKQIVLPNEAILPYDNDMVCDNFYGSLANTSAYYRGNPDEIRIATSKQDPKYYVQYTSKKKTTTSIFDMTKLEKNNPYEVFLSGNEGLIDIFTTVENDKSLLLIKDSYANAFVSYLLPYYSKITIVDPRYYYDDLNTLINDRNIHEMLFLYNANTFFSDSSLQSALMVQQ